MQSDVKKRIAVNTVMLYIRMIIVMLISLFTSRKVLEVLGVDDYGIYNVVGGVVSMLSFLNSSMTVATQRFLTFELGRKDLNRYRTVFSMAFGIRFSPQKITATLLSERALSRGRVIEHCWSSSMTKPISSIGTLFWMSGASRV